MWIDVAVWVRLLAPSLFHRSHGLDLRETSLLLGGLVLLGGTVGNLLGGWLGDRFGSARLGFYAFVPAVTFALTLPFFLGSIWVKGTALAVSFLFIPQVCSTLASGPIGAAIQHLGPVSMRATIVATYLFIVNLLGVGLGVVILGSVSDHLTRIYGADGLRHALIVCATALYPLAAIFYFLGGRFLERDALSWTAEHSQLEAT